MKTIGVPIGVVKLKHLLNTLPAFFIVSCGIISTDDPIINRTIQGTTHYCKVEGDLSIFDVKYNVSNCEDDTGVTRTTVQSFCRAAVERDGDGSFSILDFQMTNNYESDTGDASSCRINFDDGSYADYIFSSNGWTVDTNIAEDVVLSCETFNGSTTCKSRRTWM